jgi:hypothetical protein
MKSEQLDAIIQEFPGAAGEVVGDLHAHILEAASEALAASQDQDGGGKPKVTVNTKLVINLAESPPSWMVKASVGVTYSAESESQTLDDPNQPKLPFKEWVEQQTKDTSVTITDGDASVTINGKGKKEAKP